MSSYRKQGGLLRGLLGEDTSGSPTHGHGLEEALKEEDEQRRSLEQQRVSPQGSLFSMDGPAPSSSVVGRSYLRTPSMQGPWGLPQPFHGASTPPRIPSSSSSAAAGPLSTQPLSDAHTRTIGFAVPASAPPSSAGLPRPSWVASSPPSVTAASAASAASDHSTSGSRRGAAVPPSQRQTEHGELTEPLLPPTPPSPSQQHQQEQEAFPLSPRAAWSQLHSTPSTNAGLHVGPCGLPSLQHHHHHEQQQQQQQLLQQQKQQQQQDVAESDLGTQVSVDASLLQQQHQHQQQPQEQGAPGGAAAGPKGRKGRKGRKDLVGRDSGAATTPHIGIVDGGNLKAMVFGMINGAVGLPALIAFTAIVFQAPVFAPQLGSLCKMFFFSSAIHQLVFCARSTLPFAIGQVQDVGLIFLSAMASSIAAMCSDAGLPSEVALGTTLLTLTISTAVVGFFTVLVGKYRVAQLVQYVPLPVVGGYLGYVGYFCVAGGTGLGTSTTINTFHSWTQLLSTHNLIKLIPTVSTSLLLVTIMERCEHPLALPSALLSVPLLFHIVLYFSGYTLKDAQDNGWVIQPPPADGQMQYFWQLWDMFNIRQHGLSGIYWPALVAQGPKLAGLFLVVCFGSCMDVAAIQQAMPLPIDFNREMTTVGISNVCVGCIGAGYTGSYIFSQTTFTMRAGVYNRLCGVVVAIIEIIVFALPFSVVEYCPSFFFGSLLLWFGSEICRDWLVMSHRKQSFPEYALLWCTFAFIMALGLEAGIAAGIVASTLYFAYEYAQSQVAALVQIAASSGTAHGYEAARLLELMAARHVAMSVSGYIFFGSSLALSARVEEVADKLLRDVKDLEAAADSALAQHQAEVLAASAGVKQTTPTATLPLVLQDSRPHQDKHPQAEQQQLQQQGGEHHGEGGHSLPPSLAWADAVKAMSDASLYVILDCRHVTHVDSTGARTFGSLNSSLGARGVRLIFAGLSPHASGTRKLLAAHGVRLRAGPEVVVADLGTAAAAAAFHLEQQRQHQQTGGGWCWEFRSLAAAEAHVERSYLATALARGLLPAPAPRVGLQEVLSTHAEELPMTLSEVASLVFSLMPYFHTKRLMSGEVLVRVGENVEELMLIEQGFLQLHLGPANGTGSASAAAGAAAAASTTAAQTAAVDAQREQQQKQPSEGFGYPALLSDAGGSSKEVHVRTSQYGPGCFVAAHEFFLRRPAASTAVAVTIPTSTPTPTLSTASDSNLNYSAIPSISTPVLSTTSDPNLNNDSLQLQHANQTAEPVAPAHHAGARSGGRLRGPSGAGILSEDEEEEADKVESAIRRGAGCTVLCLSRSAFEAALRDAPGALSLLQWAALRSVCLDLTAALDLMERNSTL